MRRSWVIAACAAGLLAPASASAGGGPVSPVLGGSGVSTWTGAVNFVAVSTGPDTIIERVIRNGGVVERTRVIEGHYGIPGAAYDGSTTGLSADGRTLVLAEFTRATTRTRLLVLDTRTLRVRKRIALPEFVSVDAISPDGRTLYVLRYPKSQGGGLTYDVMALDLRTGRLRGEPIMDPREPDEKMGGIPLTRTMSPDMRWVYTLYSGEHNFVHALDTQAGTARCIDLPGGDLSAERLALDGPTLQVGDVATVDLRTFALAKAPPTPVATPPAAPTPTPAPAKDDGGIPWLPVALGLAALGALGLLTRRMRTHRPEPFEISLRQHVDAEREEEKATL
jgi:dipeptidyl aminopeptidase/acylaminoacyl peptidase